MFNTWTGGTWAGGDWFDWSPPYVPAGAGSPTYVSGAAGDSGRDWDAPYQDVVLTFSRAVQDQALSVGDVAAGHTIKVGGTPQTTTYRSGSGTAAWTVRIPRLCANGEVLTYSYSQTTGATVAVDDAQELSTTTDAAVVNNLTKRLRMLLKDKTGAAIASTVVKLAVHKYAGGVVSDAAWMEREQKGTPTTTSAGLLDVEYVGASAVGGTVYVVVLTPNATPTEAMIWTSTVV